MASIADCIAKLKLSPADAEEIRRLAREAGDPIKGVSTYKDSLKTDLESLRTSLSDKGYDFSIRKPASELGAKPAADARMVDLGYDVTNVANNTVENINLARAVHDTLPGMWMGKEDFFKWWGTNNERVINFFHGQKAEAAGVEGKRKFKDFEDETEIAINARVFQETFPELFQEARRGVVSDAQAAKEAVKMGKGQSLDQNVDNIVNTPTGYAANSSEQAFVKLTIGALRDDMRRLKTQALNVNKNMTDDELDAIEGELERRTSQQVMLFAKQAGFETEAGRALRATGVSPADSMGKFTKAGVKAVRTITGTAKSKEERVALLQDLGKAMDMLDPENTQQLDLFVANLHQNKANLSDVFYEMYYNWGLLSNPSTQVINFLGNSATLSLEMTERLIAAGTMPSEMRPLAKRFEGYMHALPDAFKAAWRAYKTEMPSDPQTRLENMDKHAIPSVRISKDGISKAGVGEEGIVIGGRQVRIPGRILLAVDDGMKLLHQRGYIYDQMLRAADEKKLTGQDRKNFYANFMKAPPSEVMQGALEEARRLTYTDKLGPGLRGFQQAIDAVPGGRLVIPFVRTPAKILLQAADMLSLPFLNEKYLSTSRTAADFAEGGFARRRAEARVFMGYSLLGTGAYLASQGMATGPSPSDPGERATFETNKIAWGVRSGNEWVQINRFDPIAIPFTFGVGLEKTLESFAASGTGLEREEGYIATLAGFLSDAVLDKSFFQGVENVVGAVMEPNRKGEAFAKGVVRSFTPAIAAGYARAADPRITAPMTFMEVIQDRIGFDERKKVPTRVDAFGRDVWNEVPGSFKGEDGALSTINRFINPFKAKSGANDPVANQIYELGIKLTPTRKKYKDIELDSAQAYVLNKAAGKMFYDFTRNAMAKPEWKGMSNAVKRVQIELFKDVSNQYGQMMLLGVYPELARRGVVENKDMKKLTAPTRSETLEYLKPNSKR